MLAARYPSYSGRQAQGWVSSHPENIPELGTWQSPADMGRMEVLSSAALGGQRTAYTKVHVYHGGSLIRTETEPILLFCDVTVTLYVFVGTQEEQSILLTIISKPNMLAWVQCVPQGIYIIYLSHHIALDRTPSLHISLPKNTCYIM